MHEHGHHEFRLPRNVQGADARILYARLFLDSMLGDQTLFARSDSVEESWRIIDPIANYWEKNLSVPLPEYPGRKLGTLKKAKIWSAATDAVGNDA